MNTNISLGFIGCGAHCLHAHAETLIQRRDTQTQFAYDPSHHAISALRGIAPIKSCKSETSLLKQSIDAVCIMSPDDDHAPSLLRAVMAHKHVFVEKPLATTSHQLTIVKQALALAAERGLTISSCHPRRFDPPFIWLKNSLPSLIERLGNIQSFEFDFSYHTPSRAWKHQRGLLIDHANHEIDLLQWLLGSSSFKASRLINTPCAYHVVGVRNDSVRFSFSGTRLLRTRVFRESLRLRFDCGEIILIATEGRAQIINHRTGEATELTTPTTDYRLRAKAVNDNFIESIHGNEPCYLTHSDLLTNTAFGVMLTEHEHWEQ